MVARAGEIGCTSSQQVRCQARHLNAFAGAILLLLGGANHLAQLVFLGKFTGENTQVLDQLVARGNHRFLGSNLTIGLNTEFKLGDKRVRHLWRC